MAGPILLKLFNKKKIAGKISRERTGRGHHLMLRIQALTQLLVQTQEELFKSLKVDHY
jgi:hypothetical protein